MNIRYPNTIKSTAAQRLNQAPQRSRILLIFCGILVALSAVTTVITALLGKAMSGAGGLGNLGTRSILSTFQTLVPFAQILAVLMLELGLQAAMLRISRGKYTSAQTLRTGLARFRPLLGFNIFKLTIFCAVAMAALYISIFLFFLTPLSAKTTALMMPVLTSGVDSQTAVNTLLMDEAFMAEFFNTLTPVFFLFAGVYFVASLPITYRLAVASYIIIDDPRIGGFRAMRESVRMTRRNAFTFFRLDLSFWWYYVLNGLCMVLCYFDLLFPLLGWETSFSAEALGYIFYGIYLIAQAAMYYFFRPRLEVSKALIYDAIRPREEQAGGVVLGNIFQMQ